MADANSTRSSKKTTKGRLVPESMNGSAEDSFNLSLGQLLFSDPQRNRRNAVVVANHPDPFVGIDAGDLVRIDFTRNQILDGLYVITYNDSWIGYRFFQRMIGGLHVREPDGMRPVTPKMLEHIKVVGKVNDIYRSVNKEAHHA